MNWIKSNPFVAALSGGTLVLCVALFFLASRGASRFEKAQNDFDNAFRDVKAAESVQPYPIAENLDGKRKALNEYAAEIGELRSLFDVYRPGELQNVAVQAFTSELVAAAEETGKALTDVGCQLPDGYFLGFEQYRGQLANSNATGVLLYQLKAIKGAMEELAKAGPSQLIRIYREPVPEESGGQYEGEKDDVSREFGFEVTFKGSEASVREFLTSLGKTGDYYFVVRCVEIVNERDTPPKKSDASFQAPADALAPETTTAEDVFSGAFAPLDEEGASGDDAAAEADAPLEAPAAPSADSSRILAQVLGNEELGVMVRFDLVKFLPSKELPKP